MLLGRRAQAQQHNPAPSQQKSRSCIFKIPGYQKKVDHISWSDHCGEIDQLPCIWALGRTAYPLIWIVFHIYLPVVVPMYVLDFFFNE